MDGAALLGGLGWLLLIPAAELERRNALSYDGYNRFLALPLAFFVLALPTAPRAMVVKDVLAKAGFLTS